MKPYFRVTWNVLKYNLIKFFKCKNLKIRGFVLLGDNTILQVHNTSQIWIGINVVSDGRCVIIADKNAKVEIGDKVYFNENVMISAKKNITIGNGCQFGPNVKIFDNNHQFNKEKGVLFEHTMGDVIIGNNCWIAANVIILKGAVIGDNCVISAGCVVKEYIPPASIVTQERAIKIVPIEDREL